MIKIVIQIIIKKIVRKSFKYFFFIRLYIYSISKVLPNTDDCIIVNNL